MISLILTIALVIRIIRLDQSLWLDEATQAILSSESIRNIIFQRGADFHPPLSYILLHVWLFFGTSEIWLRLLSVIFGVLTVWLCYLLALKIFDKRTAILSAFLFSIAPYHVYYSQEVRMYAQATFFASLSVYFFYYLLQKENLRNYFGYILATLALILTHYEGFFLILAQLIYLIVSRKDQLVKIIKALAVLILLYLPWLPQFFIQLAGGLNIDQYLPGWREVLSLSSHKALPLTFLKFTLGRISFDNQLIYILIGVVVLSIVGITLFKGVSKLNSPNSKFLLYWLAVPILTSYLISFKIPINQPFRILFVLPTFYILLAKGIQSFQAHKNFILAFWIGIALFGSFLYFSTPKFLREDWKNASAFVVNSLQNEDLVIFAWPEPMPPFKWYGKNKQAMGVIEKFPATDEQLQKSLKVAEGKKGIYFFEYLQPLADPEKLIQKHLSSSGFKLKQTFDFSGVGFVYHYVK